MREQEYFEEKLIEGAEIHVDIDQTYKEKVKVLGNIFKNAFGQPVGDFKQILEYTFFVRGIPTPESEGKLEKVLKNFITAIRYFTYLGMDEDKINRQLSNFGITINRTEWSPVGGDKVNMKKYNQFWTDEYPNDVPKEVNEGLLQFLLDEGVNAKTKILSLKEEVDAISENVEIKCEVSKGSFKKGVGLKAITLKGNDIGEKVAKIEKNADEVSSVIGLLG